MLIGYIRANAPLLRHGVFTCVRLRKSPPTVSSWGKAWKNDRVGSTISGTYVNPMNDASFAKMLHHIVPTGLGIERRAYHKGPDTSPALPYEHLPVHGSVTGPFCWMSCDFDMRQFFFKEIVAANLTLVVVQYIYFASLNMEIVKAILGQPEFILFSRLGVRSHFRCRCCVGLCAYFFSGWYF
jgi:hypothetical protein